MTELFASAVEVLPMSAVIPDPGSGEAPPVGAGFTTILGWVKWLALAVCVAGLMIAGATMAIQSRRGEGGEHMGRIVMVLTGVIVIAAATSLIGFLVDASATS
ncbi:hypothetical protein SAMN02745673_00927 [Marinactinospora thermotolerans DSM 45154]|uniref:TrbC/VIRB2 family protein n=1 Tax=Marinactinospora thermotolerans DSM 45154 TaxID=1122192 RepID=A0A1T4M407_9ACTN|nr:hypothetical protein [Marinactinospora thermotolerans]SJZ61474.1 hypothetical protein SAMN02745673_00927 [Marinactinospora thermotolerans DSM 45154]